MNETLQVSGLRFETQLRTFNQFPDTLLGNLLTLILIYLNIHKSF